MSATSARLLASSAHKFYDPEIDIDWDAPVDGDLRFMPFERVTLYGTKLWEQMSEEQRLQLSRLELASVAGTGLWFEMALIQMLVRHAFNRDPQGDDVQYALTEIGDETRHIIIFAPVLVAEETLDRLQREAMNDELVHPLVRMVSKIHVVEEARHVSFGRGEVASTFPYLNPASQAVHSLLTAVVSAAVVSVLVNKKVYADVGLDPKEAARQARRNPHHHETRRFMGAKVMAFLDEQGMVPWFTKPIYKAVHLI